MGSLAPQQGHQHDAPCKDKIDRHGATDALDALVSNLLDAATGFENAAEVFNPPAQAIAA
jgi:hypothetical protein